MSNEDIGSDRDAAAGVGQPISEIDVFDAGPLIPLGVEPSDGEEGLLSDRAAAGPEGLDLRA